jgi:hypothetical protein
LELILDDSLAATDTALFYRPSVATRRISLVRAAKSKKAAAALSRQIISQLLRKNSRRQTKSPLVRFFIGYTYIAFASWEKRNAEQAYPRAKVPAGCKSSSEVFKNEPSRHPGGEDGDSECARSAESAESYE